MLKHYLFLYITSSFKHNRKVRKKLNITVLSSNQALIWETLESINKNSSIKGYGSLFS